MELVNKFFAMVTDLKENSKTIIVMGKEKLFIKKGILKGESGGREKKTEFLYWPIQMGNPSKENIKMIS